VTRQTPVDYAEGTLGVHDVYEQAQEAHTALRSALDTYAAEAKRIRQANDGVEQREHDLAAELRGETPDMSQEALKRALKDAHRTDETLVSMRKVLHDAQGKQEDAHAAIESNKYRLRVLSARMNELGGLLSFFASAKNAAAQRSVKKADDLTNEE